MYGDPQANMRKLVATLILLFAFAPAWANAAVAFDNATMGTVQSANTSMTLSHTVNSNVNDIVLEAVVSNASAGSDLLTGVTYNSVTSTSATNIFEPNQGSSGRYLDLYYNVGTATGAHNAVASASGSTIIQMMTASYTGVNQTTPINNSGTADPQGITAYQVSTTPSISNCWGVMFTWANINPGQSISAGTNISTLRNYSSTSGQQSIALGDSNGVISSGTAYTMNMTVSTGAFGNIIGISLCPAAAASSAPAYFNVTWW
jgi:hypothetical protein